MATYMKVSVNALLDFIKNRKIEVMTTCTENLQSFHKPKGNKMLSPVKAGEFASRKRRKVEFDADTRGSYQEFFEGVVKNQIGFGCHRFPFMQMLTPANPFSLEQEHDYLNALDGERVLRDLHLDEVSDDFVKDVEEKTRNEADSEEWLRYRLYRITASKVGQVIKGTDKNKWLIKSIFHHYPLRTRAVLHGKNNEQAAIDSYSEVTGNAVQKCGLFICKDYPYIGASPDGLVGEHIALEVKCPYKSRESLISIVTVPYLEKGPTGLTLKKDHDYFYQAQLQLFVTNRQYCHFVVYTLKDMQIIIIERDEQTISKIISKSKDYYHTTIVPALKNKFVYKNYYDYRSFYCK